MRKNSILDHALALADRGWRVFPCESRGKKPQLKDWPRRATCDPAQVKSLFSGHPEANIGVATGQGSGIFVLDVDGPAGQKSLLQWEASGRLIPDTLRVETDRGCHLYLACPPNTEVRSSASKLAPGLDIREREAM